jgi:hypothetical protein
MEGPPAKQGVMEAGTRCRCDAGEWAGLLRNQPACTAGGSGRGGPRDMIATTGAGPGVGRASRPRPGSNLPDGLPGLAGGQEKTTGVPPHSNPGVAGRVLRCPAGSCDDGRRRAWIRLAPPTKPTGHGPAVQQVGAGGRRARWRRPSPLKRPSPETAGLRSSEIPRGLRAEPGCSASGSVDSSVRTAGRTPP